MDARRDEDRFCERKVLDHPYETRNSPGWIDVNAKITAFDSLRDEGTDCVGVLVRICPHRRSESLIALQQGAMQNPDSRGFGQRHANPVANEREQPISRRSLGALRLSKQRPDPLGSTLKHRLEKTRLVTKVIVYELAVALCSAGNLTDRRSLSTLELEERGCRVEDLRACGEGPFVGRKSSRSFAAACRRCHGHIRNTATTAHNAAAKFRTWSVVRALFQRVLLGRACG